MTPRGPNGLVRLAALEGSSGRQKRRLRPQAILQILDKRVPQYLDDVDQGKLIYPACKRKPSDAHGDVRSIWDHTRLEAIRYVTMVPRSEFEPLADPSRQTEMLEAYLRQQPHEDTVIEFTGSTMSELAIVIVAGLNCIFN